MVSQTETKYGSVTLSAHATSKVRCRTAEPKEEEWLDKSKPYCSDIGEYTVVVQQKEMDRVGFEPTTSANFF